MSQDNNAPAAVRATRKRKAPATFGSAHIPSSHEAAAAKRMAQPTVASAAKVVGAGRGRGRGRGRRGRGRIRVVTTSGTALN